MTTTLVLPWFPVILAVGVGGRLLGRARGFALGFLCALFWIMLVQASSGPQIWWDRWTVASIVAGALAIFTMGGWAGETPVGRRASTEPARPEEVIPAAASPQEEGSVLGQLAAIMDQFDDWLEDHRNDGNPWSRFDEFVRAALYQGCRGTHVKPYRLLAEGEELVPLREPDPLVGERHLSARRGILGHVVTTGRAYIAGDETQGELVRRLAVESGEKAAWCFAVKQGTQRLGVVVIGELEIPPERNVQRLRTMERLITQFWCTLAEVNRCRSAVMDDLVSGLYTREAFLRLAEQSLNESYSQGEPVAVAVVGLEGLRQLNDSGRWEVADELVREAGRFLRRKVRMDDRLGRFDGSRFVVLLRRVDSELASLIVGQIMARLTTICGDHARWRAAVGARCGVVGSGTDQPGLRALISRALVECRRARQEHAPIASDLRSSPVKKAQGS